MAWNPLLLVIQISLEVFYNSLCFPQFFHFCWPKKACAYKVKYLKGQQTYLVDQNLSFQFLRLNGDQFSKILLKMKG